MLGNDGGAGRLPGRRFRRQDDVRPDRPEEVRPAGHLRGLLLPEVAPPAHVEVGVRGLRPAIAIHRFRDGVPAQSRYRLPSGGRWGQFR